MSKFKDITIDKHNMKEANLKITRELIVKTSTGTSNITLTFDTDDREIDDKKIDNIIHNIIGELKGELL